MGPGKSTYMFSSKRLLVSAPRQASVVRATWQGSGKQKAEDVWRKTYMLIYPDPIYYDLFYNNYLLSHKVLNCIMKLTTILSKGINGSHIMFQRLATVSV
jgi:hypothetical protein